MKRERGCFIYNGAKTKSGERKGRLKEPVWKKRISV